MTNPDDLRILQTRRRDVALGLADGLQAWLKNTDLKPLPTPAPKPIVYPLINIQINGAPHEEKGILVNGNAFFPSEVLDVLNIKPEAVDRRITQNGVVFVRAIDLRDRDISVTWDQATHQYRCDRAAISSQALEKSWVAL